jgi:bifunctional UDP-N-acetylglucosamine pyrophosphorylase / glucosamine-1-phosphate N-acetyltransferase
MKRLTTVILAAGQGTRMKSDIPKPLHKAAGKPLCEWAMVAANDLSDEKPVLVIGNGQELVKEYFGDDVRYALQAERKGTGHAALMAKEYFEDSDGFVMIIAGDMPLLTKETLKRVYDEATKEGVVGSLLCAKVDDPKGYGRLVTDYAGYAHKIVEEKDADTDIRKINKVNASVYCIKADVLLECLKSLKTDNVQGEYYLTDIISMISDKGDNVVPVITTAEECIGVNDRLQLYDVAKVLFDRRRKQLMKDGVTLIDPNSTFVSYDAVVENDVIIYPNVTIEGHSVIKKGCTLYPNSRINNSVIGQRCVVESSVVLSSEVGSDTTIGPFAYLRPNSKIGNGCRIGDFVEVKNAEIKDGAKVSHLSYIGDGEIGENTNIGCGVVFVNYNGKDKFKTTVGDNCFVGCNANLISPVNIGDGAYIAAGSTVTQDVPSDSLCIARSRQTVKEGWKKYRK